MWKRIKVWWRDEWFKTDPRKYGHHVPIRLTNPLVFNQIPNSFRGKYGGPRFNPNLEWVNFAHGRLHVINNRYHVGDLWETHWVDFYFSDPMDAIQAKLIFGD